jgi:uncharacterized protein (TIGR02996 family)
VRSHGLYPKHLIGIEEMKACPMNDEAGFLTAIRATPEDDATRLVYADWLEDRGDVRGDFLRLHLAMKSLSPDHVQRVNGEHELSELRSSIDPAWLGVVEPEHILLQDDANYPPACECVESLERDRKPQVPNFHVEGQDTECGAWKRLLELIEEAATDGREEFAPLRGMNLQDRSRIVTLPATIAKLTKVKHLLLYGSELVRIPPEIGEMTSLEEFTPYTSYRLHWFPYEITRCTNLKESTVSTRALYGNYKNRPPFPVLQPRTTFAGGRVEPERLPLKRWNLVTTRNCGVCNRPFADQRQHRVWISLLVATDVLPLLVNACSEECIQRLPSSPDNYVKGPHRGGRNVKQPAPHF